MPPIRSPLVDWPVDCRSLDRLRAPVLPICHATDDDNCGLAAASSGRVVRGRYDARSRSETRKGNSRGRIRAFGEARRVSGEPGRARRTRPIEQQRALPGPRLSVSVDRCQPTVAHGRWPSVAPSDSRDAAPRRMALRQAASASGETAGTFLSGHPHNAGRRQDTRSRVLS
jgi:hypothetical protein